MFILREGKAVACMKGEQGEFEVMHYNDAGAYFGEIALLSGEPRKASVYAVGICVCLYITRATFMRVLGSLSSLLERNMSKYEKYQDAIANAVTEDDDQILSVGERDEDTFEGATPQQRKVTHRKRVRESLKPDISK